MTPETSEWLTIAEAARRLGLSDRHARRLTDRLAEQDRLKQGTSPLRVRLTALAQLWEREGAEAESPTPTGAESDAEADSPADIEDAVSRARLEERLEAAESMVAELREDKQRLLEILQREQENHFRLLEQLSDERRDLRLMHARTVQALPFAAEPEPPPFRASPPQESESESDSPPYVPPPLPAEPARPPAPTPPTLWQRLARWISD